MAKSEIINNDAVTVRVDESVADILSEASDVIEQTVDLLEKQVERVVTVTRNNPWLFVAGAVVGIGIGGFFAYKYAVKKTAEQYEVEMAEQIQEAKDFYGRLNKQGSFETPEDAVANLVPAEVAAEALTSYLGVEKVAYNKVVDVVVTPPSEDPRPPIKNVFKDSVDPRSWDYAEELKRREENPGVPFVISFDEFSENPDKNDQITLTYYSGDDILCDMNDTPVENPNYTVGDDNLTRFGAGSQDNRAVYIRNERISADFEVILSDGAYAQEVLGQPAGELRHSATRHPNRLRNTSTPRRFRERDE